MSAQLSGLLAERRFSTQVTLNEIAENENYRFLSRTISLGEMMLLPAKAVTTNLTRLRFGLVFCLIKNLD